MRENVKTEILLGGQEVSVVNPAVTMEKSAGNHTRVTVSGIVREESYGLLERSGFGTEVMIQIEEIMGTLFLGILTSLDMHILDAEGKEYRELYLEAMSATCLMDQTKKSAAFQKKSAGCREITDLVLKDYRGAGCIIVPEAGAGSMGRFVVQYEETDWEFLSRLASFRSLPLVASHKAKGVKFTLGLPGREEAYELKEEEEGELEAIYGASFEAVRRKEMPPADCRCLGWQVEDPEAPSFEVGDCILYQRRKYYVKEARVEIKDHVFRQYCLLCGQNGFRVPERKNQALTGLSLSGKVKEVKNNRLQITLDIDAMEGTECWFAYSTFYSTFYCMPEKGDGINLYFPDHHEEHAFVLNSLRAEPGQAAAGITGRRKLEDAELEMTGAGTGTGTAAGEVRHSGIKKEILREEESEMAGLSSYLAQLASPDYGRLVNAGAALDEMGGEHVPEGRDMGGGGYGGNPGGSGLAGNSYGGGCFGGSPETGGKGGGKGKDYDFESLAQNENVKVLCTRDGRMVILDDDQGSVSVVCSNGTYIVLEESGISIITDEMIWFEAAEDIRLRAGTELYLTAEDELRMDCGESMIKMTPEKISIKGTDIWLNEEE